MNDTIITLKHMASQETVAKYGHRLEIDFIGVKVIFADFLLGERVKFTKVITWGELEHMRPVHCERTIVEAARKFHEGITRLVMEHKAEERRKKG